MSTPYGPTLLDHFRRPRNQGSLPSPDAAHEALNPLCGDRIRVELALRDGVVADARFRGDACAIGIAAASLLTESVRGVPVAAALALDRQDVLRLLEAEIPESRLRCALLPLEALHRALGGALGGA